MTFPSRFRLVNLIIGATIGLNTGCLGFSMISMPAGNEQEGGKVLYDFRVMTSLDKWKESSDTVRTPGMSKGAFVLQKSQLFQRAVFFSLLNPQPNGAGFVSFYTADHLNLTGFNGIEMKVRGQGENMVYKLMFKHEGHTMDDGSVSYQAFFEVPLREWKVVTVPLDSFKAYFRGRLQPDAKPLDRSQISLIGLQIVGGVYSDFKQAGTASLEIDYIKAV
ncbi:UNVERIFIED_CONTAM: hypothetical protein GTU68_005626 [Idotea baltica]|nr:hypothetical protein [Idotea baltica]